MFLKAQKNTIDATLLKEEVCNVQLDCIFFTLRKMTKKYIVFRTKEEHNHEESEVGSSTKLTYEIKEKINSFLDLHIKPKRMMEILASQGFTIKKSQLTNYLSSLKNKKYGPSQISLGELEQWCIDNSLFPEDDDKPYVVQHRIKYSDENKENHGENQREFCIFVSTKRLLKNATIRNNIHIDAIYKLVWEGMPVIIIRTTDLDRHFHPTGMVVCSGESSTEFEFIFKSLIIGIENNNEKIKVDFLISNAIRNGFESIFGADKTKIMCWAHMRRNTAKKIESIVNINNRAELLDDIDSLQLSSSREVFEKAKPLFIEKWKHESKFIAYMLNQWLTSHQTWYEGVAMLTPSTNNALESFNLCIKKEETCRERLPLARYLKLTLKMLEKWSTDYVLKLRLFNINTTIHLNEWTKGYQLSKSNLNVFPLDGNTFICPAGGKTITMEELLDVKQLKWNTFDAFKQIAFKGWIVKLPQKENWSNGQCTCPNYLKKYMCKHIIGLAIVLRNVKPPPAAKQLPIGVMRRRGRPKLATKALIID